MTKSRRSVGLWILWVKEDDLDTIEYALHATASGMTTEARESARQIIRASETLRAQIRYQRGE